MKEMKLNVFFVAALLGTLFLTACTEDEPSPTPGNLRLNIEGLEDLGADYIYENWLIVDGSPVSTGLFSVNENGELSNDSFEVDEEVLKNATTFVLTIEPNPDPDPSPSDVHILAGDFNGDAATLTIDHGAAIGSDFTSSTGDYILATPTDTDDTNELSGVWFLNPATGPGPGLELPELPAGWLYEGWAVINGTPVSTGTFLTASGADNDGRFSGTEQGPPYPGEDFLTNAPSGLSFPTDLSEATIVISVEPSPDNSTAPFLLKPLVSNVPANALDHSLYNMNNNATATNPTGSASR